ncbi:hypothetical protein C3469_11910 [Mycobacterium kansasii]|nr:hypothetical protein C3479_03790 [Mycobacterium kansasii]POY27231.1 hypothetical protein C3469_11910 [Mycobacterium kansasii]
MNRFQFVADHSDTFEVKRLCQATNISRSSYCAWLSAAEARAARVAADAEPAEQIRAVHDADNICGRPRITAEINDGKPADQRINHKRIGRVMRENAIQGLRLRRKHRTTIPEPADTASKDLLDRDFTATEPNTKYVGDATYLPCGQGQFLYLATVIDCFSRRLVGWSIADHMSYMDSYGAALTSDIIRGYRMAGPSHRVMNRHSSIPSRGGCTGSVRMDCTVRRVISASSLSAVVSKP